MILLTLFSQFLDEDGLSALATALETFRGSPDQQPDEPGNPKFPVLKKSKELKDFVGHQSWALFNLVKNDAK